MTDCKASKTKYGEFNEVEKPKALLTKNSVKFDVLGRYRQDLYENCDEQAI